MAIIKNQFGGGMYAGDTQLLGVAIPIVLPSIKNGLVRLTEFKYTPGANSHRLTTMRPIARTILAVAAAAAQATITLQKDPGTIYTDGTSFFQTGGSVAALAVAVNQWVVLKNNDGVFVAAQVASITGLVVTLKNYYPVGGIAAVASGNLSTAIAAAQDVYFYGLAYNQTGPVQSSTDPRTGRPHPSWLMATGSTFDLLGDQNGSVIFNSLAADEPILCIVDNVTAAGTVIQAAYNYAQE